MKWIIIFAVVLHLFSITVVVQAQTWGGAKPTVQEWGGAPLDPTLTNENNGGVLGDINQNTQPASYSGGEGSPGGYTGGEGSPYDYAGGKTSAPTTKTGTVDGGEKPGTVDGGDLLRPGEDGAGFGPAGRDGGGNIGGSISLQNPLKATSIQQFFLMIIDIMLVFAVPIIVFFLILAGFKYVTARGNTEQIKQATTALTWALVGGVLILGAKILLEVIQNTVDALR